MSQETLATLPQQQQPPTPQQAPTPVQPQQSQQQATAEQQQATAIQQQMLNAINNMIFAAQELSYALALLPDHLPDQYPEIKELVTAARSVVRAVYEFHKLVKAYTRGSRRA